MEPRFEAPLLNAIRATAKSRRDAEKMAHGVANRRRASITRVEKNLGSRLRVTPDGIFSANIELAPGIMVIAGAIVVSGDRLPETVKQAIIGQPVTRLMRHPLLDSCIMIDDVDELMQSDRLILRGHIRSIDDMVDDVSWKDSRYDLSRSIRQPHRMPTFRQVRCHALLSIPATLGILGFLCHVDATVSGVMLTLGIMLHAVTMTIGGIDRHDADIKKAEKMRIDRLVGTTNKI